MLRREGNEGLDGMLGGLLFATNALRRLDFLLSTLLLRTGGSAGGGSLTGAGWGEGSDDGAFVLVGDCSLERSLFRREPLADGDGDLDDDVDLNGFRARVAILPDIERVFVGRAVGSGSLASCGVLEASSGFVPAASLDSSSVDAVQRDTVI